jgi:hypothetical protein
LKQGRLSPRFRTIQVDPKDLASTKAGRHET